MIEIQLTEDGSPTARHIIDGISGEAMHHLGGALSETLYIYRPAIEWGFSQIARPAVLSVGLGLGYNELITAAYSVQSHKPFYLQSFESDEVLKIQFLKFLNEDMESDHYRAILKGVSTQLKVDDAQILSALRNALQTGSWVLRDALHGESIFDTRFDVILYDLYSAKTLESLWTEEFLIEFLRKVAHTSCAFATYAAKGNLKRALRKNDFNVEIREGFQGKRQSTYATKNSRG